MQPVRWGVMSGSNFASREMAPAINQAEGAILAAVATADAAKAARFAAFQPLLRVIPTYQALLDDPEIDAVYLPLPNSLHVEWTEKALRAGKHVLTEKPVALRATEIDRLIAARDASERLAAEAWMIAHHPQWQRTRDLLAEGVIGALRQVDSVFTYPNFDPANIRNRADTAGGSLRDIGVYTLGSVLYATGQEPRDIRCQLQIEAGIDASARVQAEFDGFSFQMLTSMRMARRQEVVFHGTEGVLRLTAPFNAGIFGEATIVIARPDQSIEQLRFPAVQQYKLQVEAFCRSVRDGVPYPWRLEDSRRIQRFIDRAFEAAAA